MVRLALWNAGNPLWPFRYVRSADWGRFMLLVKILNLEYTGVYDTVINSGGIFLTDRQLFP